MLSLKDSADFLVSSDMINREDTFTLEDVWSAVSKKIIKYIPSEDEAKEFIQKKADALCEVGLISYTGLYYYAN